MGGSMSRRDVASAHFGQFRAGLPDQTGRTVAITGTTSGTGFVAAQALGELGARVLLLNRPSERATAALAKLREVVPDGHFEAVECDLQSFESVRRAVAEVRKLTPNGLDVLACNAGVMALEDKATKDGYDVQMQTNHLSHFLLIHGLVPQLQLAAAHRNDARVVMHSSIARYGPDLDARYLGPNGGNLGGNGSSMVFGGARWVRYHQTKLANAVLAYVLKDVFEERNIKIKALLCHPGLASTNLQVTTNQDGGMGGMFGSMVMRFAQSQEDGSMGLLRCIVDPEAKTGDFFGPAGGKRALSGPAVKLEPEEALTSPENKKVLWEESCKATGISPESFGMA